MRSAKRSTHLLILLLLLAFFAQGMAHLRSASLTFDEGPHLATGYATLRTGDFRLQPVHIHPPLANILSAMLLLLQDDLPDPRTIDGWDIASLSAVTDAVVWQYPHPERLALVGRLPILWLAVLLGALICRWARDLGGPRAGLLALTLFAFDPNMIAHGTLITTDMAATMLSVATLYAASRQVGEKAKKRKSEKAERQGSENFVGWMGVGVLLGLALLAKVSSLMLVPVLGLVIAGHEWRMANGEFHGSRFTQYILRLIPYAASLALPAMLVVWAGYGFEVGQVPGLPFPIPAATHVRIYQSLQEHYELGHPTFLLGQVSSHGWWWYFPVAFVLKTPLPMLLLALYAVVCAAYRVRRDVLTHSTHALRSAHYVALLFPLLYAATSLFSTVNIGYRHLLPLLPFLYIGVANCKLQVATSKSRASHFTFHALRITHYALLLWLILGTLAVAPHDLAFFNELAGGPAGGYRYLVDSNLDWGQNLWQLREW
ncbi:MAG TPA: phospholipid carrier-dependent glycosyltransferase, partial [Anaerolineae bacterium]|nr:phospholipid carrier-dependent glycosyltransferase [Anaerolineae bacterium]